MAHSERSREPRPPGSMTLARVMARIEGDPALAQARRGEMLSALRTVVRLLNVEPGSIVADPADMRQRLAGLSHVTAQLSRGRWNNIRSLTLAALKTAGIAVMPGRGSAPSAEAWKALSAALPGFGARCALSRLITFCTAQVIEPTAVDAAVFERFHAALLTESFVRLPETVYRNAVIAWNSAATGIAGWPQVQIPLPDRSRRFSMPWSAFPESLREETEAYLNRVANADPFSDDYAVSVSPSTVEQRRKQLQQIATALTRSGVPAETITGLAVLVDVKNAGRALRFLWDRAGGVSTTSIHDRAVLLHTVARKHGASADHLKQLADLNRKLAVKKRGMTDKNRARLRQFDDPANVDALLGLPYRVLRQVERTDRGKRADALRVMLAVAVELLIVAPVRVKNLTALELDRHLVRTRVGADAVVHLVIAQEEIKNGEPFEMALPPESAALLADYIATYRPRLCATPSSWVFPNDEGNRRVISTFSTQIGEFVKEETGITMNVHLFRHLAVKLHLDAHPEDVETARRVLGHKSIATTLRYYADLRSPEAFRRYDAMIASMRAGAPSRALAPRRGATA